MAMCDPVIVTSEGETIKFKRAMVFIGALQNLVPEGNTGLYNRGVDLNRSILNSGSALPGAITTGKCVTTSDVSGFYRVFNGALTVETMGQGCDTELTKEY